VARQCNHPIRLLTPSGGENEPSDLSNLGQLSLLQSGRSNDFVKAVCHGKHITR
jgi:hypothetical protein